VTRSTTRQPTVTTFSQDRNIFPCLPRPPLRPPQLTVARCKIRTLGLIIAIAKNNFPIHPGHFVSNTAARDHPLKAQRAGIFVATHTIIDLLPRPIRWGPRCAKRKALTGKLTSGGPGRPLGWGEGLNRPIQTEIIFGNRYKCGYALMPLRPAPTAPSKTSPTFNHTRCALLPKTNFTFPTG
jgi:hypothetical protein